MWPQHLSAGLALKGIQATVIGVDIREDVFTYPERGSTSRLPLLGALDKLPVRDNAVDTVIATYSLPMWAKSAMEIENFYVECGRVLKAGGLLSIFPVAVTTHQMSPGFTGHAERQGRVLAARGGARDIETSSDWLPMSFNLEAISARKVLFRSPDTNKS